MPATYSRVAWLMLIPALAFAAPKANKHNKKADKAAADKAAADKAAADKAASDKAAADDTTKDSATKDDKSLVSGGTVGGGAGGGGSGATNGGGAGSASGSDATTGMGSAAAEPPAANEPDVDALRQEYLSLRDELFKSRARANAVASQPYSTRVSIKLTWTSGRYYGVTKASIRLDGASVYEDAGGAIATDDGVRFDGYVAPGRHLVAFHVEATGKDDDSFTSTTESQVVVKAIASKDLVVAAKAHDSGDIAYEWKRKERGSYGLGIDVSVKTAAPAAGGGEAAPAKGSKK